MMDGIGVAVFHTQAVVDFLDRKTGKWEKREALYIPTVVAKSKKEISDQIRAVDRLDASNKTDQTSVKSAQKRLSGFLKLDVEDEFFTSSRFKLVVGEDNPQLMTTAEIVEKEKEKDGKNQGKQNKNKRKGGKKEAGFSTLFVI